MKGCFSCIFLGFLLTGGAARAVVGTPVSCAVRAGAPGTVEIFWAASPGARYLVEFTEDLRTEWAVDPCGPGVLRAVTNALRAAVSVAGHARFFRVLELPGEPPNPDPDYLVWLPPGTFMMGTPEEEQDRAKVDGPLTRVTLTQGYWLGKYEVTIDQYRAFLLAGGDPGGVDWADRDCPILRDENFSLSGNNFGHRGDQPMVEITWAGAMAYCQWLTEVARQEGRLPEGYAFSLPTEAQWEYACRAGTSTRYSFGDALDCPGASCVPCAALDDYFWWCGNSGSMTHPVGLKRPNPWGLYDMHGNVWEWCWNFWEWRLPGGAQVDPLGPSDSRFRTRRGGSWASFAKDCRSGLRFGGTPTGSIFSLGLRVALVPQR
jgi:formylglycine-generating enzyme required for sulfatase activity